MRHLTLLIFVLAISASTFGQTMNITNFSACDVQYYVTATDPLCGTTVSSIIYVIPAGGTMSLTFGSTIWSGAGPGVGWQWSFIKGGNFCGPYNYLFPVCTSLATANDNVFVMGIPCTGFGMTQCVNMTTACNNLACSWIRCAWTPLLGGNVQVDIG